MFPRNGLLDAHLLEDLYDRICMRKHPHKYRTSSQATRRLLCWVARCNTILHFVGRTGLTSPYCVEKLRSNTFKYMQTRFVCFVFGMTLTMNRKLPIMFSWSEHHQSRDPWFESSCSHFEAGNFVHSTLPRFIQWYAWVYGNIQWWKYVNE